MESFHYAAYGTEILSLGISVRHYSIRQGASGIAGVFVEVGDDGGRAENAVLICALSPQTPRMLGIPIYAVLLCVSFSKAQE